MFRVRQWAQSFPSNPGAFSRIWEDRGSHIWLKCTWVGKLSRGSEDFLNHKCCHQWARRENFVSVGCWHPKELWLWIQNSCGYCRHWRKNTHSTHIASGNTNSPRTLLSMRSFFAGFAIDLWEDGWAGKKIKWQEFWLWGNVEGSEVEDSPKNTEDPGFRPRTASQSMEKERGALDSAS